jgi:hypothetical protein
MNVHRQKNEDLVINLPLIPPIDFQKVKKYKLAGAKLKDFSGFLFL